MAPPLTSGPGAPQRRLLQAATDGDLRLFKSIASALDGGKGRVKEAVEAVRDRGAGRCSPPPATGGCRCARTCSRSLDVNAADDQGISLIMVPIQKSLVNMELWLSMWQLEQCNKAMSIHYTPLIAALHVRSLKCVKFLIKAGADVKGVGQLTPLIVAANDGLTDFYKCLLEAGADPDVRDDGGQLPIEIAACNSRRKDVEILFPVTSCIPYVRDWSVDGILAYVKSAPKEEDGPLYKMGPTYLKLEGSKVYKRKDYVSAINFYSMAIKLDPEDVTLHSNKSLCWINLGKGDKALEEVEFCRMIRPDWPKACHRQGAAQMLLKGGTELLEDISSQNGL